LGDEVRDLLLRVKGEARCRARKPALQRPGRNTWIAVIKPALEQKSGLLSDRFRRQFGRLPRGGRAISRAQIDWLNAFGDRGHDA